MTDSLTDSVAALVAAAGDGDERAWSELVGRYTPLVYAVINRYRLDRADAADANQTVWLRLVEQLPRIRDPHGLPLWLITTARNECLRVHREGRRTRSMDPFDTAFESAVSVHRPDAEDGVAAGLLEYERHQVLRDGLRQLPIRCRQLLTLLVADPPVSYDEISARVGIPLGSVGPTRARCLEKLRGCPAVAAFQAASGGERTGTDESGGGRRDIATPVG